MHSLQQADLRYADMIKRGYKPLIQTYRVLLAAAAQECMTRQILEYLEDMDDQHVPPDQRTFTILMEAYVNKPMELLHFYYRMRRERVGSSVKTYTAIMQCMLNAKQSVPLISPVLSVCFADESGTSVLRQSAEGVRAKLVPPNTLLMLSCLSAAHLLVCAGTRRWTVSTPSCASGTCPVWRPGPS